MLPKSDFPVKSQIIMTTETRGMNSTFCVASALKLRKHFLCIFAWFGNMAVSLCFHTVYHQNNYLATIQSSMLCKTKLYQVGTFSWVCTVPFFFCFFPLSSPVFLEMFAKSRENDQILLHLLCKLILSVQPFSFGLPGSDS